MIVAVTGGRNFVGTPAHAWALRGALLMLGATRLRHGGCSGADLWCARVAKRMGLPIDCFPADWSLGRRAGPRRNEAMVTGADALVALPGGIGTADCTRRATAKGLTIMEICA